MRRLLALTLVLLSLCACAPAAEPASGEEYGLWFAVESDGVRRDYSAVAREGRRWEQEPSVRALVQALLDGPESDGLYAPFPGGVTIHTIDVDEETKTARVDLSEQYGGLAGFELTLADYCITLTLCQLPQVETVRVTVEGKIIPYRDRQDLRTGDVLLSGITAEEPDTFLAALYFPSRTGGALTAEYRQVSRTDGSSAVEIVMAELLRGPTDRLGSLPLPEGTQVRSLTVRDGLCQVDLSEEFLRNAPEEEQAGLTVYALVNTLCALSGISQVQLLVEGESVEAYGGVSTGAPLSPNFDFAK